MGSKDKESKGLDQDFRGAKHLIEPNKKVFLSIKKILVEKTNKK